MPPICPKAVKCHNTRRARFPGAGEPETLARQKVLRNSYRREINGRRTEKLFFQGSYWHSNTELQFVDSQQNCRYAPSCGL